MCVSADGRWRGEGGANVGVGIFAMFLIKELFGIFEKISIVLAVYLMGHWREVVFYTFGPARMKNRDFYFLPSKNWSQLASEKRSLYR